MKDSNRVISIDVFRGLTILIMVFVNDVASVKGLPWWTYHIPGGEQGLTYVDIVYPAFLFIVGMSIPIAIQKRLTFGHSKLRLISHILIRTISLAIIGLLIMNGRAMSPELTGMSYPLWNVLMFFGVILFWNVYPKNLDEKYKFLPHLKWLGLALLVYLLIIYKREVDGVSQWIHPRNWSILGGIAFAYLSVCLIYLASKNFYYLAVAYIALILLDVGSSAGIIEFQKGLHPLIWPFGSGTTAAITLSGLLASLIFVKNKFGNSVKKKLLAGSVYTLLLALTGYLLLPYGLSKIMGSPSWGILSSMFSLSVFIILYLLIDVYQNVRWANFIRPAGSNPLLTYLLPDVFYAIFTVQWLQESTGTGSTGVIRALIFTLFILAWSAFMTKYKIRLQM
jgi:predicted acyltransferase